MEQTDFSLAKKPKLFLVQYKKEAVARGREDSGRSPVDGSHVLPEHRLTLGYKETKAHTMSLDQETKIIQS